MAESKYKAGDRVKINSTCFSKSYPQGLKGTVLEGVFPGVSPACKVSFENGQVEWFYDGYLDLLPKDTGEVYYPCFF